MRAICGEEENVGMNWYQYWTKYALQGWLDEKFAYYQNVIQMTKRARETVAASEDEDLCCNQNRGFNWPYLGSRVKLADMSAVKDAIGLSKSPLVPWLNPRYPDPGADDADVAFV